MGGWECARSDSYLEGKESLIGYQLSRVKLFITVRRGWVVRGPVVLSAAMLFRHWETSRADELARAASTMMPVVFVDGAMI